MYNINSLIDIQKEAEEKSKTLFTEFFIDHIINGELSETNRKIRKKLVTCSEDLKVVPDNAGFYVILSNYKLSDNPNKYEIKEHVDGKEVLFKAVYRGEASHRRSRIIGHLFRKKYEGTDVNFMKVDNNNGINIDLDKKYSKYDWMVITYSLDKCNQFLRMKMESAFDDVFNDGKTPLFSSV